MMKHSGEQQLDIERAQEDLLRRVAAMEIKLEILRSHVARLDKLVWHVDAVDDPDPGIYGQTHILRVIHDGCADPAAIMGDLPDPTEDA
jgi:hypothetical protein